MRHACCYGALQTFTWSLFVNPRYHCAIETEEAVVLTGGSASMSLVTKYNMEGKAEDLPSLITGRYNHACGETANSDGSIVSLGTWKHDECNFPLPSTLQTYIVTGGYGGQILSSTEILVKEGGTSWKSAAELPYTARSLRGVSLDSGHFIVTGEDILGMAFWYWLTISSLSIFGCESIPISHTLVLVCQSVS